MKHETAWDKSKHDEVSDRVIADADAQPATYTAEERATWLCAMTAMMPMLAEKREAAAKADGDAIPPSVVREDVARAAGWLADAAVAEFRRRFPPREEATREAMTPELRELADAAVAFSDDGAEGPESLRLIHAAKAYTAAAGGGS